MKELQTALDDLVGLREAATALGDPERRGLLVKKQALAKSLRRELAAAADAYAATVMSSAGGILDSARLKKCRRNALGEMPEALGHQKALAELVNQRRLAAPAIRADLEQLLALSLHCRAALAALVPLVGRRTADSVGNRLLVALREATLVYLASAGEVGSDDNARPRAAVVAHLAKTDSHAADMARLVPEDSSNGESLGATLSRQFVHELHRTALDWNAPEAAPSATP